MLHECWRVSFDAAWTNADIEVHEIERELWTHHNRYRVRDGDRLDVTCGMIYFDDCDAGCGQLAWLRVAAVQALASDVPGAHCTQLHAPRASDLTQARAPFGVVQLVLAEVQQGQLAAPRAVPARSKLGHNTGAFFE